MPVLCSAASRSVPRRNGDGASVQSRKRQGGQGGAAMAKCEQGYLCEVCGAEVEGITESDLYLRYVLGEVGPGWLPLSRERHIRCNPALAQYIVDPSFEPVPCDSP